MRPHSSSIERARALSDTKGIVSRGEQIMPRGSVSARPTRRVAGVDGEDPPHPYWPPPV